MAKEHTGITMAKNTLATGRMTSCTDKAKKHLKTALYMLETSNLVKKTGMVSTAGLIKHSIMANGVKIT